MLRTAALAIVLGLSWHAAQAECAMEDGEINVVGTVARATFAGPPNYESIADGDKPETYWILTTSQSIVICPAGAEKSGGTATRAGQQRLQLILDDKQYELYGPLLNQRVSVKGKVWSAQTGHHHTGALVTVEDMRAAAAATGNATRCPGPFSDFLLMFESDETFRLEHVQFPLHVTYIDAAAIPEPAARTKQVSRDAFISAGLYPTAETQTLRGLKKRIIELSAMEAVVHFDQRDTDSYTVEYRFKRESDCWHLMQIDDQSL